MHAAIIPVLSKLLLSYLSKARGSSPGRGIGPQVGGEWGWSANNRSHSYSYLYPFRRSQFAKQCVQALRFR
ncbi:hypothetical protein BJ138DRAFT_1166774 [Hygrophoropsis aurantiaca]|uniref:Uncharacterized protein n=1 Tax=Hygrophoropsis aurantiaca TaxID=72124 RepID=A0ACB7ZU28_9AGAM|nr:hypothetical protein BJ138DRAFT_1166774 [Hygrophoropsis aurantiaca]